MSRTLSTIAVSTGVVTGTLATAGTALGSDCDTGRDPVTGEGNYICDTAHLSFDACDPGNIGERVNYPYFDGVVSPSKSSTTQPSSPAITDAVNWDAVAACESSGNWATNTGNGFFGGLQFQQSTWDQFGGKTFAPRADLASKNQQIQIARKVLAGQGIGAWPVCGKRGVSSPVNLTSVHTAVASRAQAVVNTARTWIGVPYRLGGNTRSGVDCSGLTQQVFRSNGVSLPRTADQQMHASRRITKTQALPGDLVFGVTNGVAHHVGIVIGPGTMIDSPTAGSTVGIHKFYRDDTVFGRVL
jgi:cell wall-associated NlpC family hydrolase